MLDRLQQLPVGAIVPLLILLIAACLAIGVGLACLTVRRQR